MLGTVTSMRVASMTPSPFKSHWVVWLSPVALVVTTVLSRSEPFALRSLTVSVRLPLALRTVTSVRLWSTVPVPSLSHCVVTDRPLALVVLKVRSFSDPFTL